MPQDAVTDATIARMGAPVPNGWAQPDPWPVRRYDGLRLAVLHLHRACLLCGGPAEDCSRVDTSGTKEPGNLVGLCRRCTVRRPSWTAPERQRLTETAAADAATLERMTGWSLPRAPRTRAQPKKPSRPDASGRPKRGRPTTRDPNEPMVRVVVEFRERDIQKELKLFSRRGELAAAVRERFLDRESGRVPELEEVARRLTRVAHGYQVAVSSLGEILRDYPDGAWGAHARRHVFAVYSALTDTQWSARDLLRDIMGVDHGRALAEMAPWFRDFFPRAGEE